MGRVLSFCRIFEFVVYYYCRNDKHQQEACYVDGYEPCDKERKAAELSGNDGEASQDGDCSAAKIRFFFDKGSSGYSSAADDDKGVVEHGEPGLLVAADVEYDAYSGDGEADIADGFLDGGTDGVDVGADTALFLVALHEDVEGYADCGNR